MTAKTLKGLLTAFAVTGLATGAFAGSDLEKAMQAGAEKLTSDEIAERLKGKTVTFVSANDASYKVLVFYGEGNQAEARKVGGDKTRTGFQAVNDRDQICLGWEGGDLPRLRCIDVLLIDGVMHKFSADGSLSGSIVEVDEGNTT